MKERLTPKQRELFRRLCDGPLLRRFPDRDVSIEALRRKGLASIGYDAESMGVVTLTTKGESHANHR